MLFHEQNPRNHNSFRHAQIIITVGLLRLKTLGKTDQTVTDRPMKLELSFLAPCIFDREYHKSV